MTTKPQRKKIARQLPPAGTTFTGRSKGQSHTAVIVEAKDRPAGRAVKYGDQLFASLSAAAIAERDAPFGDYSEALPAEKPLGAPHAD